MLVCSPLCGFNFDLGRANAMGFEHSHQRLNYRHRGFRLLRLRSSHMAFPNALRDLHRAFLSSSMTRSLLFRFCNSSFPYEGQLHRSPLRVTTDQLPSLVHHQRWKALTSPVQELSQSDGVLAAKRKQYVPVSQFVAAFIIWVT